jgi:hypothetical protein
MVFKSMLSKKHLTLVLFLFVLLGSQSLSAQQKIINEFPKSYLGKWKGSLEIMDEKGQLINEVEIHFNLVPLDEYKWTWLMEYPKHEPKIEKNYLLIQDNDFSRNFYIDENNGIIINQFWTGNRLLGSYHLDGKIYDTTLSLRGETLYFEIIIMKLPEQSSEVKNLEIIQVQIAILKRMD